MSDDKKKGRSSVDTARRIWLAGIGAYGRAFTEAQEAIKDMTGETSKVFEDLVEKGEVLEMAVTAKRKELMDKTGMPDVKMPNFDMPDLNMEDRIAKMRSRLMRGEDVADDMTAMNTRLDTIEAKLDKVLAMLEAQNKPVRKPAAKKTTPKKRTPTRKTSK